MNTSQATLRRTVEEWQQHVGTQIRDERLRRNVTQHRLAHLADVSPVTIHHLESGAGSSLATLIKVVRALDRQDWLEQLARPAPTFSPLQELDQQQQRRRQRASPDPGDG